jgi:hypothetical protein
MKEIIYPNKWEKINKMWSVIYQRHTARGIEVHTKFDYINGYRQAVKDIKKLNK